MASALAIQLQRLKAAATPSAPTVRGKPSLLFSYQDAADIDVDTIYHLGLAGLQDLASRDSRFRAFESSLFSRDLLSQNREHHNKEWNAQVSAVISGFLQLVSNYFLQPSAFRTLEYLIRKFKVNELEVHELLLCALPYHTTNEFVRLVQVLALKNTPWEFLNKVQSNGVALPRSNLVHRCLKHQEVLKSICEGALKAAKPDVANRAYLSFFAVTVCETLQAMSKVKEDTVAMLLPYMLAGLHKGVIADLRGASIMIFSQLAARAPLGLKLLSKLITQLAKGAEPRDVRVVALILAQLSSSQPHLTMLPAKALKAALKLPRFDQALASVACTASSSSMLRLVNSSLCSALPQHPTLGAHLASILHTVPLHSEVAESLACRLLQDGARSCCQGISAAAAAEEERPEAAAVKEALLKAVCILEQRYPAEVDAATNKVLGQAQAVNASLAQDQDAAQDGQDEDPGEGDEAAWKAGVIAFVKEAFHGGMHCPLSDDPGITLARAVSAPAASVRAMAVQQIGELLEASDLSAASRPSAEAMVIQRIRDDDWDVVKAALHLKALPAIAPAALIPALTAVLRRSEAAVTEPAAAAAGMKAISVLASLLSEDNLVPVASALVPYLLLTPALHRLCFAALRALSTSSHPLFAHLQAPSDNTKRPKKVPTGITFAVTDDNGVITATIQALSKAIVTTPQLAPAVAQLALATSPNGCHVLLLALAHACSIAPSASSAAVAIIDIVKATWPQSAPALPVPTDASDTWVAQATSIFTPTCLPLATYIPMLHNSLAHLHAVVHLRALHAAVALLAPNPADSLFSSTFDTLTHLRPPEPFYPHLDVLANKLPATTSVPFLAQHMVTSVDATPAATIAHILSTLVPHPEVPLEAIKAILPNVLTALSSDHPPLRIGALHLAVAARDRLLQPPPSGPAGSASLLAEFIDSLLAHGELIKNDGTSLALLVNNTLCPQRAASPADSAPRLPTITLPTSAAAINAAWAFLTASLSTLSGLAASGNVLCLLSCLSNAADPGAILKAALPQLQRIITTPAASLTAADTQLATAILGLVTPAAHSQAPASIPQLLAIITAPPTPALRAAAFSALSPELLSSLAAPQQREVLKVLLSTSAADRDGDCRAAARACLEAAPISAAAVSQLLPVQAAAAAKPTLQGVPTPGKKTKQAAAPVIISTDNHSPAQAIQALEMLQWKTPLPAPSSQLLAALQALVSTLLPAITSIMVPHRELEDGPAAAAAASDSGSLSGYAVQLSLMTIKRVLEEGDASAPAAVDLGLAVACAQQAPDSVVRNAALLVVATVAASRPESTLDHVLQVMSVVSQTAVMQEDVYSTRIAAATLTAVVPAWAKAGRSTSELWQAVVSSLGAVPASRRLALLSTLKEVLPEDEGVHVAMLHLLRLVAPVAGHASITPASVDEHATACATWAPEVASLLSVQVLPAARLRAFSRLLSASLDGSSPEEALPRTVVAFVISQLQLKSLVVAARKLFVSSSAGTNPQMAELQAGGKGLMDSALAQLQAVGTQMDLEGASSARALQAASEGLHTLIRALEGVMPSVLYIQALVQLQGPQSTDACRRRTLRLLASKISALQQEAADMAVLAPTKKQARLAGITTAVMELVPHLPFLLDPATSSPTTRQAALLAIDALVLQFGATSASTIASILPPIITACSDVAPAVRASALTSAATVIRALGHKVVAHVPSAVRAILAAANSSAEAIAHCSAQTTAGNDTPAQSTAQQQSLVLAAALAALQALVEHTAALMSPYIGAVLQLLLCPQVLECTSLHCSTFGTRLRRSLPTSLPPRMLLAPLHDQLGPALEAGANPATALLEICTAVAVAMDSRSAAAYHVKLFFLFLTALGVRQTQPPALRPGNGIYKVESEAVRGAVALVMKLSEANFKPLFLALMEWTNEAPEPASDTAAVPSDNMGRICAMMALADALAQRLRSVFVPYFRYLLDVCVHFLTTGAGLDSKALKRLKKKRRESLSADANGGSPPVSAVDLETSWVLRANIVRSLHRCFLYDSVAFLDQDRFSRLLHPLIAQLDATPPAEVVAALTAQCADAELDGAVETTASLDLMGRAVVGCLAQMATSAGSDAMWKPLNQQVLMMTRSESSRTRLLGLEVVSQLIGRLREEFLVLLPESLPFLAELLEDRDTGVERRTQEVVKVLEELSGEKLDEYMK